MSDAPRLEDLLDPTAFEDEMTLYAIAVLEMRVADGLVEIVDTLPSGDRRRPGLLAYAQYWHQAPGESYRPAGSRRPLRKSDLAAAGRRVD